MVLHHSQKSLKGPEIWGTGDWQGRGALFCIFLAGVLHTNLAKNSGGGGLN